MKNLVLILVLFISFSCKKKDVKPIEKQIPIIDYNFNASEIYGGDTLIIKLNGVKTYRRFKCKTGDIVSFYYSPYVGENDTVARKKYLDVVISRITTPKDISLLKYKGWYKIKTEFKI